MIRLDRDGKLFPIWVMHKFKQYTINSTKYDTSELENYQKFIGAYLNYESPYKEILIYHGNTDDYGMQMALHIYNLYQNYTKDWTIICLLPSWVSGKNLKTNVVNYDLSSGEKDFNNIVNSGKVTTNTLYVIDNIHLFISMIYNNKNLNDLQKYDYYYQYLI